MRLIEEREKRDRLLSIEVKYATSINKSCDDEQDQKHNESNHPESQQPSWVDFF